MKNLKEFYLSLSKKKKIIFIISVTVIFLSLIRVIAKSRVDYDRIDAKKYIRQLKSSDQTERQKAISQVGPGKIKKAIPLLEKILADDPDLNTKKNAAFSLGKLDEEKLFSKLDSSDKNIKEAVVDALLKLEKTKQAVRYGSSSLEGQKDVKNAINYTDRIITRFSEFNEQTKMNVLQLMNSPQFETNLIIIVENQDESVIVRKDALRMLNNVGTNTVVGRLEKLQDDSKTPEEIRTLSRETTRIIKNKDKTGSN
jgi:HEAT repeat protein